MKSQPVKVRMALRCANCNRTIHSGTRAVYVEQVDRVFHDDKCVARFESVVTHIGDGPNLLKGLVTFL